MTLIENILKVLGTVLKGDVFKPLHEPLFVGNEWKYVKECIDTAWVSSVGKFVDRFEEMLSDYTGAKQAIAIVNGTAALHVALGLAEVKTGDEVIVPALSFVATANAVSYLGAVPHFADCEERTLGMDPGKLGDHLERIAEKRNNGCYNNKTGRRIAAVVPMHTFGHPVNMDALLAVCGRFGIPVLEDAAESIGSYYKGKHCGTIGHIGILSFNGNKTITTGGGGAILTNDERLGRLARHLTTIAKVPHKWEYVHDQVGYNYRLPNINAALGCAQMETLQQFLRQKRSLAEAYARAFEGVKGVGFFLEPEGCKSNYWLNAILLDREDFKIRDEVIEKTNRAGFMTRPVWRLLHRLLMYRDCPRMDLSVAERLEKRIINIPSGPKLYVEA